mmetsp:Transcript_125213/g.245485  ORF Transcript_125213/g.245485 Transcript_125213/m.245485 type:complete len:149 (+) Transcript_125213:167-613(+)
MADWDVSHTKNDMVRNHRVNDEFSAGNSSTGSPTTRSCGSHHSQLHGNKGFDMIESFFSTIFGGCCRPSHCSDGVIPVCIKKTTRHPTESIFKVETPRREPWENIQQIPRPPQIRRIALDDEFSEQLCLDRSKSLNFLFNHGGQANSS